MKRLKEKGERLKLQIAIPVTLYAQIKAQSVLTHQTEADVVVEACEVYFSTLPWSQAMGTHLNNASKEVS